MPTTYVSKISQWIEKRYNAKGGNVITDVDPTAVVQVPLAIGVEDRYLQAWNRFGIVVTQTAVAAQFARARIRNPVGSNVIVVLEMANAITTVTDQPGIQWGAVTVDLATIASTTFSRMDPRGNPSPTSILSTTTQAALGTNNLQRVGTQGNVDFIFNLDQQIPILPGNGVDITAGTVNTSLIVSWEWRERALEQSELT